MSIEMTLDIRTAEAREVLFKDLYQSAFPQVAGFVRARNGSLQDARDIFHDALIIFYEKMMHEDFVPEVSHEAYVLGISRNLWLRKFRKEKDHVMLSEWESMIDIPKEVTLTHEENRLLRFLEAAGKKCLDLLSAFYFDRDDLERISEKFGYSNVRSATVQKFKCLEKIRDIVKQKSASYEDFHE